MRQSSSTSDPEPLGGFLLGGLFEDAETSGQLDDRALVRAMLQAESALAAAGEGVGLIPTDAAAAIRSAADTSAGGLIHGMARLGNAAELAGNPVPELVTRLTAAVPESARPYVHLGATSQDILDTALGLCGVAAAEVIARHCRKAARSAADLAADHRSTLMVSRTLGQHAVPTTFGLLAAGWAVALDGAAAALAAAARSVPAQLGGAGGTLAGYGRHGPELARSFAARLGLAEPGPVPWHTDRRPWIRLVSAAAQVAGAAGKVADDVVRLAATDVAELRIEAEGKGGSSAMPHKRNPVDAILVAAGVTRIPGLVSTLLAASVHDHQRAAGAWHAEWQPLRECLALTGGAVRRTADVVPAIRVDAEKMERNLGRTGGAVMAESLAARLVPSLGRDAAQQCVRRVVATAAADARTIAEVAAADDDIRAVLSDDDVAAALDPRSWIGSAGEMVDAAVAAVRRAR